jgi:hypothetical protein
MTHEERARAIVAAFSKHEYYLPVDSEEVLCGLIATGMAEASNAELERRRAVEAERDRLRRIVESMAVAVKPCAACGTKLYFVPMRNDIGLAAFEESGRDHMDSDCGKEGA